MLFEGISADKSNGKEVLKNWVENIVPGYLYGSVPNAKDENDVILEERTDPSNTNSKERLELLKSWISEVGGSLFQDNEENKSYINIVKTHLVNSPESYREWFEALRTLAKDLLTKSTQKWNWPSGDRNAAAEMVTHLLMPFRQDWVKSKHQAQFQNLVSSLASKRPKSGISTWAAVKNFANKEIAEEIFKIGGINVEVPDDEPAPTFEVLPDMDDEPVIVAEKTKKRKPTKEKQAVKKTKTQEEPAKPTPKPRGGRKRNTSEPAEESEVPLRSKKKVSFGFEEPTPFEPEPPAPEPAPRPQARSSEAPPNWKDFMPGSGPAKAPKAKKTTAPKTRFRKPKKVKKQLQDVEAEDLLQVWDYPLNEDKTEPGEGLALAVRRAHGDPNFKIIRAAALADGDRFFGRRILLKTEFYQNMPATISDEHIQKKANYGGKFYKSNELLTT